MKSKNAGNNKNIHSKKAT